MTEKKITVRGLLTEDNRKRLADLLLNNNIQNMVVIYRKENYFQCDTSEEAVATTIGMLDMAKTLVMNDWLCQDIYKDDNQDSEAESS